MEELKHKTIISKKSERKLSNMKGKFIGFGKSFLVHLTFRLL